MMNLKILTRWCTKRAVFTAHHRAKANRSLEHIRRTRVVRHGEAFGEAEAVRLARVLDDQALERNTSPGGRK